MSEINVFEHCTRCGISLDDTSIPICERCASRRQPDAYICEMHRMRVHDLGRMTIECPKCHALHWKAEKTSGTLVNPRYESCCKQGKVVIPQLQQPPQLFVDLLTGQHEKSNHFLTNIRQFNATFAFTSFGATNGNVRENRSGISVFKVHGELYHLQGPLSDNEVQPTYSQLYIYDPEYAAIQRSSNNNDLDRQLITQITQLLYSDCNNPFVRMYQHAFEILSRENERQAENNESEPFNVAISPEMRMNLIVGNDRRTQNLPTANEIAAIVPNEYSERSVRDIIVTFRSNNEGNEDQFRRIHETHAAYMPLHYVLLFPRGDYGWNWGLRLTGEDDSDTSVAETRLTQRSYYRYRLHTRLEEFSTIFYAKRLFQQYVVDVWGICDQNALNWIRHNQSSLRADVYNGVVDAVSGGDYNLNDIGTRYILPSSYTGGPRYMAKLYQDAMAIVRHMGKPSLFITFTANPQWIEIQNELLPGQTANDRPDIVARVFHLKVKQLLQDLKGKGQKIGIFGKYRGLVRTIEYQKRGLPHLHLLLFLEHQNGDFSSADHIDQIISAELPNIATDPNLYAIISRNMMHGPCGSVNPNAPCMIEDYLGQKVCSKGFPKPYQQSTITGQNGYPLYRRRLNDRVHLSSTHQFLMDNSWVVPYNPYLSKRYNAHINVEVCASVKAIKYINKYIYKGSDQTTVEMGTDNDEIKKYLNGRYISPVEAVWRIMEFPMHEEYPTVYQLPVHLPGEQPVVFDTNASSTEIASVLDNTKSKLMAFFDYNNSHPESREYLYQDYPLHFTWQSTRRVWQPRNLRPAIGRIVFCSPNAGERYYLRLLLTTIPGPTSFDDLKTVNGQTCSSFREACVLHHLVQDDQEWIRCFEEGRVFSSGSAMRSMFTSALLFGELNSPIEIWNQFKLDFCDDLEHRLNRNGLSSLLNSNHANATFYDSNYWLDYGLYLINMVLVEQSQSLPEYHLPEPEFNWTLLIEEVDSLSPNPLIRTETNFNEQNEDDLFSEKYDKLSSNQKHAFEKITTAINNNEELNKCFFIQGPAGTGKTFLYNTICHYYRRSGKIVLCVASSGIAALLLSGGRTSHSRFKIPLLINENSSCMIRKNTHLAGLIQKTSLVIWDEVPMQHKYCFEAVDRTLRDICDEPDLLFGGIPFVLGGDFAQIPPVVVRGSRAEIVSASLIKSSLIWPKLTVLELTQNMRLSQSVDNNNHLARWIGNMSYIPFMYGPVLLPQYIRRFYSETDFIADIYPDAVLRNPTMNSNFFKSRAILCARNSEVESINHEIINRVRGDTMILLSEDKCDVPEGDPITSFPPEYLHAQNISGLPPHKLVLKVGMPVMLLRNLNPDKGLCNGTRLKIHRIGQYVLLVSILGSVDESRLELIPRLSLSTLEGQLPFILTRKQFPVKPCFAMTINKSQGQSLNVVGVDLRTPVFTHGHLYVALSRSTSANGLTVLLPENMQSTNNVVYPELLLTNNR